MKTTNNLFSIKNKKILELAKKNRVPFFLYDKNQIKERAMSLKTFGDKNNTLVRYAIKANPHKTVIDMFNRKNSSGLCPGPFCAKIYK